MYEKFIKIDTLQIHLQYANIKKKNTIFFIYKL